MPHSSILNAAVLLALAVVAPTALAAPAQPASLKFITADRQSTAPIVLAIEFVGNDKTQPVIMRQEMSLQIGDEATGKAVETARQAVMDLGLFKSVEAELLPATDMLLALRGDGSAVDQYDSDFCKLRITVEEKWYILPIPRLSLNADGESSYGVRVRWNNLAGLNQRLSLLVRQSTNAEDDRGDSNKIGIDYDYPLALQTSYNLSFGVSAEQTATDERLILGGETPAKETQFRANVDLSRSLTANTKGWIVGAGLAYWRLNFGEFDTGIARDDVERGGGDAPSVRLVTGNNQVHDYGYSRGGWRFEGSAEHSLPLGSFHFWKLSLGGARFIQLGARDRHERLILRADIGLFNGGPRAWDEYQIGGSSNNRGFETDVGDGNLTYYFGAEYLKPIFGSNSLRGLALIDVSQVYSEVNRFKSRTPLVSVGFGIRWRVQSFVNLEIDLAIAYGLNAGEYRVTGGSNKGD